MIEDWFGKWLKVRSRTLTSKSVDQAFQWFIDDVVTMQELYDIRTIVGVSDLWSSLYIKGEQSTDFAKLQHSSDVMIRLMNEL